VGSGPGPQIREAGSLPFPGKPIGTVNREMPFEHLIVVMMENHSFDNLLGALSGTRADVAGLTFDGSGGATNWNPDNSAPPSAVEAFPLPNTVQAKHVTQTWMATHEQINGGAMDGFVRSASGAHEPMGYYTPEVLPFAYSLADAFTVANNWFCSVPGPTYPNRRFLLAGTAWGMTVTDTKQSFLHSRPPNGTIFDLLSRHHIGWCDYFTDVPSSLVIPWAVVKHLRHHHKLEKFFDDCAAGTLPAVSLVDPGQGVLRSIATSASSRSVLARQLLKIIGVNVKALPHSDTQEDPDDMYYGEVWAHKVIDAVLRSPRWERTLLIYTYDEHGGYYDHVAPPAAIPPDDIPPKLPPGEPGAYDMYGPRVPAIVVSPYSKPRGVSDLTYDHTSILATIEHKWNLPALTRRDANALTIMDFLDPASPALLRPPSIDAPAPTGPSGPVSQLT
jgi:phospholipase C